MIAVESSKGVPRWRGLLRAFGIAGLALALLACGVGSGGTGSFGVSSAGGGSVTTGTIRGFGSIIVNGVRYDDSQATVQDESGWLLARKDLKLGMVVEVESPAASATAPAAPVTGTFVTGPSTPPPPTAAPLPPDPIASRIVTRTELRGRVDAVDAVAGTITVLGQTVVADVATLFDDRLAAAMGTLYERPLVEVYGFEAASGRYLASRIDLARAEGNYRLRGTITQVDPVARTLRVGGALISYAELAPADGVVAVGRYARLELHPVPDAAGRWHALSVRSAPQVVVPASDKATMTIEGIILPGAVRTGWVVGGVPVDLSLQPITLTEMLAGGARVELVGTYVNGELRVRDLRLLPVVQTVGAATQSNTFTVRGAVEEVDPIAKTLRVRNVMLSYANAGFDGGTQQGLRPGTPVQVRAVSPGYGRTLEAMQITFGT